MSKGKGKGAKKAAAPAPGGKQQNGMQKKKPFTMLEEARRTDRAYVRRTADLRLEKRTMDFVSAGSVFQTTEEALPALSRPSSPSSVSSNEVILFTGRNKSAGLENTSSLRQAHADSNPTRQLASTNIQQPQPLVPTTIVSTALHQTFSASRHLDLSDDDDIDEEILADYIANMNSSSDDSPKPHSIKANSTDKGKQPVHASKDHIHLELANTVATRQLSPIFAHHSTESQPGSSSQAASHHSTLNHARSITTILSQRHGDVGIYYLVVYDNQDDDTAEWVESDKLLNMTPSALQFFESPMWETEDSDSIDSEVQAERDLAAMFNDEEIEDEQLRKKQTRMTDEEIAQRLAKQEELGMDSSEVLMFDGHEGFAEPVEFLRQEVGRYNLRTKKKTFQRIVSDESDFDLMDYERSSLQKSKNKRKGKMPIFDIVDSDLERDMLATWQNDRKKKKQRKQEREELRAQGLLGGGAKAKYPDGIALDELKEEFRAFLSSNSMTMLLPPMHKQDRKLVHELAHNFNIKSSSQGTGQNRHSTLNKKARTRPFTDASFDAVLNRLLKRFHGITLGGERKPGKKQFSYREGEVVGSSAPELGTENRGRAMLEKMGWSTGDALGATNNPGILNPIIHVVKSTRSGLG